MFTMATYRPIDGCAMVATVQGKDNSIGLSYVTTTFL